jgi:FKBP-type peptidyl-prolyl cis-trans isomerase
VPQIAKKEQQALGQKRSRPGQRQQERLQRQMRRQRRQRIVMGTTTAVLVITLAGLAFWQFQRYSADVVATNNLHATATAAACTPDVLTAELLANQNTAGQSDTASAPPLSPTPPPASPPAVKGVPKKLCSGLEYIDIKQGTGPVAKNGSTVNVYYTGWVQGGQKFESSYDDGKQPLSVSPLGQANVIMGWNQGLIGLKVGGTRRLIIPPSLGYGNQARGSIPANSTLIFDVTVVSIS